MIPRIGSRRRPALLKALGALLIFVGLGAWALASPVGASPDEDYHLASIWCGQGPRDGVCEPGATDTERSVPTQLEGAACYAFHPKMNAECQSGQFESSSDELVSTARGNFVGDYPPVFYFAQSLFVGHNVATSVIAMRIANAVLFVGLVTAVYVLLPVGLRRALITATLITAVPLGMFLAASINPSGWALLSAATLMLAVLGYIATEDRRRRLGLGGLAAVALLVGAGARADAAMYAIVAIGAAVLLTLRTGWPYVRRLIYPTVLAVLAGVAFLNAGQSSAVDGSAGSVPAFSLGGLARLVLSVPDLWVGALGGGGLGWLDTKMPAAIWVACWGLYAAVLFVASVGTTWRRGLAVACVGAATLLIPTYVQFLSGAPVGSYVQPRYILPLLIILAAVATVRLERRAFRLTRGQRWILVVILAGANAIALFTNIRRYVSGTEGNGLGVSGGWWWPGAPVGPVAVLLVGSVAFAVGVALVTAELAMDEPAVSTPQEAIDRAADHVDERDEPSASAVLPADDDSGAGRAEAHASLPARA